MPATFRSYDITEGSVEAVQVSPGEWSILASAGSTRIAVSAYHNEAGFGGRAWETGAALVLRVDYDYTATVGEGQHPTLRAAMLETLDMTARIERYRVEYGR